MLGLSQKKLQSNYYKEAQIISKIYFDNLIYVYIIYTLSNWSYQYKYKLFKNKILQLKNATLNFFLITRWAQQQISDVRNISELKIEL